MFGKATFFWMALAAAAGGTLFKTSYEVQALHDQLGALNREIVQEQESIKVLKAEWAYLNEPSRIELASRQFLTLKTVEAAQLGTVEQVAVRTMPLAKPAPGLPALSAPPPVPVYTPPPAPAPVAAPPVDMVDAEEGSLAPEMLEEARATAAPVTTPVAEPQPARKPAKPKTTPVRSDDAIGMLLVKLGAGQQ